MGIIFMILGILSFIVGIVGIIIAIVGKDPSFIVQIVMVIIAGIFFIFASIGQSTKQEYEVTHVEQLEQDDVRITIKKDGVSFWIIMDKEDYNNETTLNLSDDEISNYPNSKNKNV